jgi:ribosomal protein L37AE/L43A
MIEAKKDLKIDQFGKLRSTLVWTCQGCVLIATIGGYLQVTELKEREN